MAQPAWAQPAPVRLACSYETPEGDSSLLLLKVRALEHERAIGTHRAVVGHARALHPFNPPRRLDPRVLSSPRLHIDVIVLHGSLILGRE